MKARPSSCLLLGAPLALLLLLVFVLPSHRTPQLGSDGRPGALCGRRPSTTTNVVAVAPPQDLEPELSLLIGVLTVPSRRERRDIVRMAYALQPPAARARVDVRFVFCNVTDPVDAALVAVEIRRHGDVVVLDCAENMNDGKTYAYLSSVPRLFAPAPYDYVMKADDDTYLRVAALVEELRGKPRRDLYLGRGFPVGDDPAPFMHGMGYLVSWDVAEWVSGNEDIPRSNGTRGHEDRLLGKWLNAGGRGKNRYNLKPRMYDVHWDVDNFWLDTVAVHRLKDNRRWAAVFRYFNVTAGIAPSNLYHLP
ncbi:beta-1,3-galactosyltransferase pvg3-like [Panicum virgatum]|uniref:Hexosyltransferase n=1 Tax=Panicum virgatum TaxID=38727 RepID=A0A8T0W8X2_PANVG|nr:beta-1,3-galactosyltransferase pvg3-like [Panicum virgatum]KAG2643608.1 hypothetical protein PVAP13_2KG322440 [Panicum virgatum]